MEGWATARQRHLPKGRWPEPESLRSGAFGFRVSGLGFLALGSSVSIEVFFFAVLQQSALRALGSEFKVWRRGFRRWEGPLTGLSKRCWDAMSCRSRDHIRHSTSEQVVMFSKVCVGARMFGCSVRSGRFRSALTVSTTRPACLKEDALKPRRFSYSM